MNLFALENHEPVLLHNNLHERIKIEPVYFNLGFSSKSEIYSRKAVLAGLLKALDNLPAHLGFLIWDVYRTRDVQAKLFHSMQEKVRRIYPDSSDEEHYAETIKYISPPAKIGDSYCSPHLSGGAIDLTLLDLNTGEALDMGTVFDDFTERAHRDYFDSQPLLSPEEALIRKNRTLLRSALELVGFTSYYYEWWHFDLGNVFWSESTNQPEIFGPLFGDQEWP